MTDFVFSNLTGVNFRIRTDMNMPKTTTQQNLTVMYAYGIPVGINSIDEGILQNCRTGLQYTVRSFIAFAAAQGFNLDWCEIGSTDTFSRINTIATPPPATFTATETGNTTIALAWTAPTGLVLQPGTTILYTVQRATNVGFTAGVTTVVNGVNELAFNDSGLTASTEYFYEISAQVSGSAVSSLVTANATTI